VDRREKMIFVFKLCSVLFGSVAAYLVCLIFIYQSGFDEWLMFFLTKLQTQFIVVLIGVFTLMAVLSFGMTKLMGTDEEGKERSNG